MNLLIVTPYKKFYEGLVTSVVVPAVDGQMGFMAGLPPVIVAIKPGIGHLTESDDSVRYFTLSEGYLEVHEGGVKIICNTAEFPEDLSPRRTCITYTDAVKELEETMKIEDIRARQVSIDACHSAMERAASRRKLLELYGSDHQKERISILVEEYGWQDKFK